MTSSNSDLKKITTELNHLSLKRQQLLERKKILCVFQELLSRDEFGQTDQPASKQDEIDSIDNKLEQLSERKADLQKSHDIILNANNKTSKKEVSLRSNQKTVPDVPVPVSNIFYVEAPPNIPAPKVILDLENLPRHPCRTQCPDCHQYIMTETSFSVNSVTWLVCVMTALIGCVAGCCLIPFCLNKFKSTKHRCPKCQTVIHITKVL